MEPVTYTNEYVLNEPAFYYDGCRTKDDVDYYVVGKEQLNKLREHIDKFYTKEENKFNKNMMI